MCPLSRVRTSQLVGGISKVVCNLKITSECRKHGLHMFSNRCVTNSMYKSIHVSLNERVQVRST